MFTQEFNLDRLVRRQIQVPVHHGGEDKDDNDDDNGNCELTKSFSHLEKRERLDSPLIYIDSSNQWRVGIEQRDGGEGIRWEGLWVGG